MGLMPGVLRQLSSSSHPAASQREALLKLQKMAMIAPQDDQVWASHLRARYSPCGYLAISPLTACPWPYSPRCGPHTSSTCWRRCCARSSMPTTSCASRPRR